MGLTLKTKRQSQSTGTKAWLSIGLSSADIYAHGMRNITKMSLIFIKELKLFSKVRRILKLANLEVSKNLQVFVSLFKRYQKSNKTGEFLWFISRSTGFSIKTHPFTCFWGAYLLKTYRIRLLKKSFPFSLFSMKTLFSIIAGFFGRFYGG